MKQFFHQLKITKLEGSPSTGKLLNLADQIKELVAGYDDPKPKLVQIHTLELTKIGGVENEFLIVLERGDEKG
jgi:hypothetical protein